MRFPVERRTLGLLQALDFTHFEQDIVTTKAEKYHIL
jgi:hypothetical protein